MSPRWNKVGRDLWRAKLRTFLVVISITVGVFAVGTIASTRILFSQDISDGFLAINPAAAQIYPPPFTNDLVRTVRRMDASKMLRGDAEPRCASKPVRSRRPTGARYGWS